MTWPRYQHYLSAVPEAGLTLDISRMSFTEEWLASMEPAVQAAFADMEALESGAIANPDENRMVGHYWLRSPALAPTTAIREEIESTLSRIGAFAARIHAEARFTGLLSIGIGGSALGPMFVADALGHPATDRMRVHFFDNTDPDGIERVLTHLEGRLDRTLVLVISKSGGTPETYNGMKLAEAAFSRAGLSFAAHAVAITMPGSKLDRTAADQGWLDIFPMFDWVGGRTSVLSAVGLLPAALQGFDIDALLAGAAACDARTRSKATRENPAALLALMWHYATEGRGAKDMVVLPYKDRLLLFSRYLQQLIMESLGKQLDLNGVRVDQGLSVYGNKGSTDQHAYVQQLRDGVPNFFALFVRVLEDGGDALELEPGVRAGDYLDGFLLGTRQALSGNARRSITITVPRIDARTTGALIALFERATGLYASLVHINAYHQPGVEAGKKAAAAVLDLQKRILSSLTAALQPVETIASAAASDDVESVFLILEHLAANGRARRGPGTTFSR
ncbi:MAG: glucose-6-phosphate isomerase [Candidatus Solibacter usitatus]|nr:glucose-6-phosphate isomerase [Candidatus Solibacter usitatus]